VCSIYMIIIMIFLKKGRMGCFCLCVKKVKKTKKRTDKFQEGFSPSAEESKECKETDKQILEEGRHCCMRKSKECKETDRLIPEEALHHRGKKRNEVPGISLALEEEDPGSMPRIATTSEEEDPESMPGISATSGEQDPESMPGISTTSEEEDPVSMPRISAATEEERGGPRFHTQDLQGPDDGGGGRRIRVQDPGSTTRGSQGCR
jgi:hypothetical protein